MRPIRFGIIQAPEGLERWQIACVKQMLTLSDVELAFRWQPASGDIEASMSTAYSDLPAAVVFAGPTNDPRLLTSSRDVDFILTFGVGSLPPGVIEGPRYGVWRFHHGDWTHYSAGPPGFWEVHDGATTSAGLLVRLTVEEKAVIPLREGHLRTEKNPRLNREQWQERFIAWPAQLVRDISQGQTERLSAQPLQIQRISQVQPTPADLRRCRLRMLRRQIRSAFNDLFRHEQWNVGVIRAPISHVLEKGHKSCIEWFEAPRRHEFAADPFGVMRDGRPVVMFEYLDQRRPRGVIAACDETGSSESRINVDIGPKPPVHLSYPYLLEEGGRLLCIPETHEAREVGLYEIGQFPQQWNRIATLLEGVTVVDATVFHHGDYWWLTASKPAAKGSTSELHLWYSRELYGPWNEHPQNPVKIDVRSARPGGTPFVHEGVLYRPAQDCSSSYGCRIVVNRVLVLTPTQFEEEWATTVDPDPQGPRPDGLHTLSAVGDITLIDGKRFLFVPQEFKRVAAWMLGSILGLRSKSDAATRH